MLTMPLGMQVSIFGACPLARIKWEGCSRKGTRHKNGGMMEVGRWLVHMEWRQTRGSVCLPLLSSLAPRKSILLLFVPVRSLRSSDAPLLSAGRTRTAFTQRAFSVAAPYTWNLLPSDIRTCHTVYTVKKTHQTRNVGQCPTWWPPCRI